MAMPQSASLRAMTSLTPSPVMATVWPFFCRAFTSSFFCSGVTRPKTVYFSAASGMSFLLTRDISTALSQFSTPARRAMPETVSTLSPEMTLQMTPCSLK